MPDKQYISYRINEPDAEKQDILVAMLQDFGFDGFEQTDTMLIANGYDGSLDEKEVEGYLSEINAGYSKAVIKEENWNKMWESDFPPIIIEDFCAVRAGFHQPIEGVKYEIVIDPKMSFGTGHHATTWMMMKAMASIGFKDKSVIDFGTGTGLLAILAEKMGAKTIAAIDYDDWCIENSRENTAANNCSNIDIIKADNLDGSVVSDVILANINKHIILANFPDLKKYLSKNGLLVISGILTDDEIDILRTATFVGLKMVSQLERSGWLSIGFQHAA
ncbi:MAG: 50S ribosomal protein L11 methyltransferase [Bacteroidota bacterium]